MKLSGYFILSQFVLTWSMSYLLFTVYSQQSGPRLFMCIFLRAHPFVPLFVWLRSPSSLARCNYCACPGGAVNCICVAFVCEGTRARTCALAYKQQVGRHLKREREKKGEGGGGGSRL